MKHTSDKNNPNQKIANPRILFVEDEQTLVDVYKEYFTGQGFDVLTARTPVSALTAAKKSRPQVVVLDIILPREEGGMVDMVAEQGYEILKHLKKNMVTANIPVIVFTNLDTLTDRERSRKMGAAAYVFKRDTSPKELQAVIENVIALKKTN